ncbi:hypothetical protein GUJ93_ZPchr0010g9186 [Zizania palustris]|uniref:Uncharacterized protein n=1 Tax=Zizania palustris TaxID=103762 RepID=A0A8J5WCP5_ZIZPA|nr:hypothetical protein GUJ93_ZPchr0010g9186 [Zizania palustris]
MRICCGGVTVRIKRQGLTKGTRILLLGEAQEVLANLWRRCAVAYPKPNDAQVLVQCQGPYGPRQQGLGYEARSLGW